MRWITHPGEPLHSPACSSLITPYGATRPVIPTAVKFGSLDCPSLFIEIFRRKVHRNRMMPASNIFKRETGIGE